MARQATALAYGANVVKLGLSLGELAVLRSLCFLERLRKSKADGKPLPQDDPMEDLSEPVAKLGFLYNRPAPAALVHAFD